MWQWLSPIAENRISGGPAFFRLPNSFVITGLRSKLNGAPKVAPGNPAVTSPAAEVRDCLINRRLSVCILKGIVFINSLTPTLSGKKQHRHRLILSLICHLPLRQSRCIACHRSDKCRAWRLRSPEVYTVRPLFSFLFLSRGSFYLPRRPL